MLDGLFIAIISQFATGIGAILSATLGTIVCPEFATGQFAGADSFGCFFMQVLFDPLVETVLSPAFSP
jgi:hypothetical protein